MNKKLYLYISLFFCFFLNIVIDLNIKSYFKILNICFKKNIILTNNLYTLICLIIAFISILIILDILLVVSKGKNENKGIKFKKEDGTFGTATWMNEKDINKVLAFNNKPGIILGKYNEKFVKLPFDSYFNKNIAVFGSSGSMKTIGFLITNLLELSINRKSIIVTDPKRRNISYYIRLL